MATITIKFKDTLTISNDFNINIEFTSNGNTYTAIESSLLMTTRELSYINNSGQNSVYDPITNSWNNSAYQTITLDTNQTNFNAFITAMKDNIEGVLLESGTYKWVENPTQPSDLHDTYNLEFVTDNMLCRQILPNSAPSNHLGIIYFEKGNIYHTAYIFPYYEEGASGGGTWANDNLKTISVETDQYIDYDFYNYAILSNQLVKQEITKVAIDLTKLSTWETLAAGLHSVSIVAKSAGYNDSEKSAEITFNKAAAETYTLPAGTYKIVDDPEQPTTGINQELQFKSANVSYVGIKIGAGGGSNGKIFYFTDLTSSGNGVYSFFDSMWGDDNEKYLYLDKSQDVSETFYNWFTTNMTLKDTSLGAMFKDGVIEAGSTASSETAQTTYQDYLLTSKSISEFLTKCGLTEIDSYKYYLVSTIGDIDILSSGSTTRVLLSSTNYIAKMLCYVNGSWIELSNSFDDDPDGRVYKFTFTTSGTNAIMLLVANVKTALHTLTFSNDIFSIKSNYPLVCVEVGDEYVKSPYILTDDCRISFNGKLGGTIMVNNESIDDGSEIEISDKDISVDYTGPTSFFAPYDSLVTINYKK